MAAGFIFLPLTARLLVGEQLVEEGVERGILTGEGLQYVALRVDDDLRGEALNGIVVGDVAFSARIVHVEPRQLVLFDGCFPFSLGVVAVHAENLELAFVLLVVLFHLGDALDAPHAPRAPEVEHHVFSLQGRQREGACR